MILRDYQQAAVDAAITWGKYKSTPCIVDIATGGGKTHIVDALATYYHSLGQRVCIIAHRKELLEQAGSKISVPFGYYSASVGEKDTESSVIIAGIQSIYNKEFAPFDVIIADECHRMPNSQDLGQYWQFIAKHSPCKLIGLTATPFRTKGGKLGWGEIVYEAKYPLLLGLGYLTKLTNKVKNTPDLSRVKITAGEFNEADLSHVMENPELIDIAVKNIIAYGVGRDSVLIFCVTVMHAVALSKAMKASGMECAVVHGETNKIDREKILEDFKSGKLRYLINCEILLEGFDAPNVDMIVCLRPTKSKVLHEQMLGRGVRLFEGKEDCFILDMAGNLMEHGGLGAPYFDKAKKETKQETGRICPECETFNKPLARECSECGYQWPEPERSKPSHNKNADTEADAVYQPLVTYKVKNTFYREHRSKKGSTTIQIDYACNAKYGAISEWLSPYHENEWVRNKAWKWFEERGWKPYGDIKDYPVDDILFHCLELKTPIEITVDHNEKFPRIKAYKYAENRSSDTESASPLGDDAIPEFGEDCF